jgi:hypothetical protein
VTRLQSSPSRPVKPKTLLKSKKRSFLDHPRPSKFYKQVYHDRHMLNEVRRSLSSPALLKSRKF